MFKILIDTCVWLDIAKDPRQRPILGVVEEMVKLGMVSLMVPKVVIDEFNRNRDRIAKESSKSLTAHFNLVKDAVGKVSGDNKTKQVVLSYLDDVESKIPIIGGASVDMINRIEKLLTSSVIIEPSEKVKLNAVQRAIEKKAPFHHNKNSMADAILIESYAECIQDISSSGFRFAFVTHNTSDFSIEKENAKIPHPDFNGIFSRIKSLYFIKLSEALQRIDPSFVSDTLFEYSWTQEPRGLTEILEAENLLFNQVWYNRHWNMRTKIEEGKIKVVDKVINPHSSDGHETILRDVLHKSLKAARNVEHRFGMENLGPWDDFEWGMINGKLSALRWVLGDEWDMLDT